MSEQWRPYRYGEVWRYRNHDTLMMSVCESTIAPTGLSEWWVVDIGRSKSPYRFNFVDPDHGWKAHAQRVDDD